MANIIMQITDYINHLWHNTFDDIVMAENINGWEDTLQQHSQFKDLATEYYLSKNLVLLYPFGLHNKLVSEKRLVVVLSPWSGGYRGRRFEEQSR